MRTFTLVILTILLGGGAAVSQPQVGRVEFGGSIWNDSQRRAGVLFQDGAQSILLKGGSFWTFGDTFIGKPQPGQPPQNSQITGAVWATFAWLPDGTTNLPPPLEYICDTNGVAACLLKLFPDEDQKHLRLWPTDGICLGSRVYLFYSMIKTGDKPGPWNFQAVGSGLAVADLPVKQFTRLRPGGHSQFPVNPIQIIRRGRWLYLYEISDRPKGLVLARVDAKQIEKPAAYEFCTGAHWSTNRAEAKVVLREAYGQVSIAWIPALRRYVMATSSDFSRPHEIQLRESRQPEGPWSEPARIAVPEMPGKQTQIIYCTFLHPELSGAASPRLVATFCRILEGSWALSNPEWMTIMLKPTAPTKP